MSKSAGIKKRAAADYSCVLEGIFQFLLTGGMEVPEIRTLFERSIRNAASRVKATRGSNRKAGGLVLAALVLDAWHRDRRYMDSRGTPKPVRLLGPAPSVEALIRVQSRARDCRQMAHRLRALHFIVRSGAATYRPASNVALISVQDPITLQHIARSLRQYLDTVSWNLRTPRAPLLIER